ncbi:MAG: DISARM system helicase DrmA [Kofleriaceae bacterium]
MPPDRPAPVTSAQVRRHLVDALRADLVGPFSPDDDAAEVWDMAPSKRYLYGFLVPRSQGAPEPDDDDPELVDDDDATAGDDSPEGGENDQPPRRLALLPSSIGLSVLVPAGDGDHVTVRVAYADYVVDTDEPPAEGARRGKRPTARWRRVPRPPIEVVVPLVAPIRCPLGDSGLTIHGTLDRPGEVAGLAPGTRALALFVVNEREVVEDKRTRDQAYAFQVELEVRFPGGLVARPDLAGLAAETWDDQVMDVQFRAHASYAAGHGVAVETLSDGTRVIGARTAWVPEQAVPRVTTHAIAGVVVDMEALAALDDAAAVHAALDGIPAAYAAWLDAQGRAAQALDPKRREVAEAVLFGAERAERRIRAGIDLLAGDAAVRRAFCTANRAMAQAARQRSPERYRSAAPAWRMFQLAFVLLNLPGVVDDTHADRRIVELIFFPTGGGKTEAYLGVIAVALVWRRMRHAADPSGGLGVAVILRYTLRLLTLDQLGRAATLVCALEVLRATQPELGGERFSLGLWVGKSATANRLVDVAKHISEYRNGSTNLSPFPLAACPWCGEPMVAGCLKVVPTQKDPVAVEVGCASFACSFSARHGGLPLLFVDEQIYRELPSFLIATVDKFAMLPWRGESGALFGQVTHRVGRAFVGPATPTRPGGPRPVRLPDGLPPPELIVQDELHLISGPLGTMVGLYETAVEHLASRPRADGSMRVPKLIASTATVKRAAQQVRALYARDDLAMFPPPGIDDGESFFAKVDHGANGRLYLGVGATGRSAKAVLVNVYSALLSAAARCVDPAAAVGQPADPYLTLVGYFNSLRELGGMRRLVEDLIRARAATRGDLRPLDVAANPWMANRTVAEPIELTSRESTSAIAGAKAKLERRFGEDGFVDTALASNMISVGVDIERLGLMVVAGQPKSTSEYIQASSRVGRDDARPGLVVTCYNLNKPRDRSYYEHFRDYHGSFYRQVEPTSVTPFSSPALERGLAGCLLAMVRHGVAALTPATAAMDLAAHPAGVAAAIEALVARALAQPGVDGAGGATAATVRALAGGVIDRWSTFVAEAQAATGTRSYSPYDVQHPGTPLLWTALDALAARLRHEPTDQRFVAPTSMRDVEPTVHLWLRPAGWARGGAA